MAAVDGGAVCIIGCNGHRVAMRDDGSYGLVYNVATDRYTSAPDGKLIAQGWRTLVARSLGVQRKVEADHRCAYLCQHPSYPDDDPSHPAWIEWSFRFEPADAEQDSHGNSNKSLTITRLAVSLSHAIFDDTHVSIDWFIRTDADSESYVPISELPCRGTCLVKELDLTEFVRDRTWFTLKAKITVSDGAWQQAQLFRLALDEAGAAPTFSIFVQVDPGKPVSHAHEQWDSPLEKLAKDLDTLQISNEEQSRLFSR
ncbi:hypothetical protein HDU87_002078 [Geranomyces variabilis]|uniref:PAW domain-containing protein n=1 Tax=Geranomyces variabilis TaxID=109894 RepID=A0AAD5TBF9_9FUNG|nr:hypothetical protein HDU87_002078 [Geranomyces variabilis]